MKWRFWRKPKQFAAAVDRSLQGDVLTELHMALVAITEADIQKAARALTPKNEREKDLGAVHNPETLRLWALANSFDARSAEMQVAAKYGGESAEHKDWLVEQFMRVSQLGDVARLLFWIQAKDEIGSEAWKAAPAISCREGFKLVVTPQPDGPSAVMRRMMGGE